MWTRLPICVIVILATALISANSSNAADDNGRIKKLPARPHEQTNLR